MRLHQVAIDSENSMHDRQFHMPPAFGGEASDSVALAAGEAMINRQIVLSELPRTALAVRHFQGREVRCPVPADGELLLRVLYISLDAASRAWMQARPIAPASWPGR